MAMSWSVRIRQAFSISTPIAITLSTTRFCTDPTHNITVKTSRLDASIRSRFATKLRTSVLVALAVVALSQPGCATGSYPPGAPWIRSDYLDRYNSRSQLRDTPHNGIDIGLQRGNSVLAAAEGVVIFVGWDRGGGGNTVTVEHGREAGDKYVRTVYSHNDNIVVTVGDRVLRGQKIALAGDTGEKSGGWVHLHFSVWVGDRPRVWDGTWRHVSPHDYWVEGRITCFESGKSYPPTPLRFTYPVECRQ